MKIIVIINYKFLQSFYQHNPLGWVCWFVALSLIPLKQTISPSYFKNLLKANLATSSKAASTLVLSFALVSK